MYKHHSSLFPPSDDTVLWRYMDFTKFVSLLERSALFFCRADLLGDPFEGSISPAMPLAAPPDLKKGPIAMQSIDFRQIVRMVCVNCWHAGSFESAAMWRLYAKAGEGVAINTVFGRLKGSIIDEQSVSASAVKYVDYRTDAIPFGNGLLPLVHKRISFRHEREVRMLFLRSTANTEKEGSNGGYVTVDLAKLVQEIVVAPFAQDWFVYLVRSTAGRYGLEQQVRASTLADAPTFTAHFLTSKD